MLEFNELCPELLNDFIDRGMLPNFSRLRQESHVFTSDAEEEGERLNPWVQWVSVHSGLSASQHKVETLSEGVQTAGKNIWDLLSAAGHTVWVCGSMNAGYLTPLRGFVLPDPWSTGVDPYPGDAFAGYWDFVRGAVQEHSNDDAAITKKAALSFLGYMIRNGLSARTVTATVRQLLSERFSNRRWRRACIMDRLQLDLFCGIWKSCQPSFATFFLNSTAHFQHCYWRHWNPEVFEVRPSDAELADYGDAIPHGYREMDRLIGRVCRLVGPRTTIVFATGLSQQPYLKYEGSGGRNYYRPRSSAAFRDGLGLSIPHTFEPVMAGQFYLRFADTQSANQAAALLESFVVKEGTDEPGPEKMAWHVVKRENALLVQSNCTHSVAGEAVLQSTLTGRNCPFFDVLYHMESLKSGQHHPSGVLWIRRPDHVHRVYDDPVSIRAIAPTVLQWFGLTPPDDMEVTPIEEVIGKSRSNGSRAKPAPLPIGAT
jgi:hypothetical protein